MVYSQIQTLSSFFRFRIVKFIIFSLLLTCSSTVYSQQGTFIAIGSAGLYSINTNNCNTTPLTSSCSNFAGNALSIGLDGTTLYINDNLANLYSITLGPTGTVGNCDSLGKFLSGSKTIWGLTVGPDGTVYAASGSLIETYNPKTKTFGTLGSLPSKYSIGGDLLFYQGTLYEMCTNNNLVAVNLTNPSNSQLYEHFTSNESIFGLASVTLPCSPNQVFAVANSGNIYPVLMNHTNQTLTVSCKSGIPISDAASIAETESTPPPSPPVAISPVVYCVNSKSSVLTASTSGINDTLNWYTSATGSTNISAPTPDVGSTQTTTTYYVSQTDITTGCESDRTPVVVNVDTFATPSISIKTNATTICSGATAKFIASTTNEGTAPIYQWQLNGVNVGTDTSVYINNSLTDGSLICCKLTSNAKCLLSQHAISDTIKETVNTISSIPTISITASDTSISPCTVVTFKAAITNGGTLPKFVWMKNGIVVGTNNSSYTAGSLVGGDIIMCGLISNSAACLTLDTILSNKIRMHATGYPDPTIIIHTDNNTVCSNTLVTFTSTITFGGTAPIYIWSINGNEVQNGIDSTFKTTSLRDNDIVSCILKSNIPCPQHYPSLSNKIPMTIRYTPDSVITLKTIDSNICPKSTVTFYVTSPRKLQLDWGINGNYLLTNQTDSFTTNAIKDGDIIKCRFSTDYGCGIDTIYSNPFQVKIINDIPPTIVIKSDTNSICASNKITFTTITTNGGTAPVYQWNVNGVIAGTDTSVFTTNHLSDSNIAIVTCAITSNIGCLTKKDAESMPVSVNILSLPIVSPIKGENSICQGKTITLTDVSLGGNWVSNSPSIATIIPTSGVVTGKKEGITTINYLIKNSCGTTMKSFVLNVVDSPIVYTIEGTDSVCINNKIQLTETATGGNWSSQFNTIATVDNGVVSGVSPGKDSIYYTISNKCGVDYKAKLIKVVGQKLTNKPSVSTEQPTCIMPTSGIITINITGNDPSYYYEINGKKYNNGTKATNLVEGIYTAYLFNSLGCEIDSITDIKLLLKLDITCDTFYVPTVFVPFGTNYAGTKLKPYGGSSDIQKFSFKVFNRYGNLVFETHELNKGWDGTINGVLQEAGAYIWYLNYEFAINKLVQRKGTSVLIR